MTKLYFLGGLAVFSVAILITTSCKHSQTRHQPSDSLAAMIKRGDYLVNSIGSCMHCHGDRDFTKFSAPVIRGTEGKGGEEISPGIFVRNITPYALSSWTDEEIFRVLTTGIRKNGDTLTPNMPYPAYAKMPKEEIFSIIAYLRTLKPIKYDVPARKMNDTARQFWSSAYEHLFSQHVDEKLPLPSPGDKVKMGEYLVNAGNCKGCHTKFDKEKIDFDMSTYLAGGKPFKNAALHLNVNSGNLTPDSSTGIGLWTEDIFLAKFKTYRDSTQYNRNPGKYNSVMPWSILARISDDDLKAIYAYLRTIKPVQNKFEKWPQ